MKISIYLFLLISINSFSQTTLNLHSVKECSLGYHAGTNAENTNYDWAPQFAAFSINGAFGQGNNINRSVIQFDYSAIPTNATILSTSFRPTKINNAGSLQAHTIGNNESTFTCLTSSWESSSVTYANCPTTDLNNQIIGPAATSPN